MRIGAGRGVAAAVAALLVAAAIACGGGSFFRQYEYEEEMYLSLDGSATVYVNASIPALNALRGTSFDATPNARFDRDEYRRYFSSSHTHVTRVTTSRRNGRRFVHVRLDVDDVRRLGEAPPFAWSTYRFDREGDLFAFKQTVDAGPKAAPGGDAAASHASDAQPSSRTDVPDEDARVAAALAGGKWTGKELVAFRLHLPSKIEFHNTRREIGRGNILVWEQSLADRLRGAPLVLEARMETQSILYRTLWLFGLTFVLAALTFVAVIWWVVRRGAEPAARPGESGPTQIA